MQRRVGVGVLSVAMVLLTSLLATVAASGPAPDSDDSVPVPTFPAPLSRGKNTLCGTHLVAGALATGKDAVAYFAACVERPGWATTLRYHDLRQSKHSFALQLPGTEPAMLGFDDDQRVTWATTRVGIAKAATARLTVYQLDTRARAIRPVASAKLQSPSTLSAAVNGDQCWLVRSYQSSELVLVSRRSQAVSVLPSRAHERVLFWDSTDARFVFVTVPQDGSDPEWSAMDCTGVRHPLRPSLLVALRRLHSRFSDYFSSPDSDLLLISRLPGSDPSVAAVLDLDDDHEVDPGTLLGEQPAYFNGFAAHGSLQAIVTPDSIRVLRDRRLIDTIPVNYGWNDGLGFAGDRTLAMYASFQLHFLEMGL
ncbi:MAG TPA: hypothetical protein VIT90_04655 [Lysobacter sp.]